MLHQKKKILFVCTGNSCRSVMAEGLLLQGVKQKGRSDVQVLSAGTNTFPGMGPTLETIEVMKELGVDVSSHVSQQLTPDLVRSADAVFCMEDFHREQILAIHPEAESKVHLFRTFQKPAPLDNPNVPDPIGQPRHVYEACRTVIQDGVHRIMEWLEKP